MQIKKLLHLPESKYTARQIVVWLWAAWRGNRRQAAINASLGLLGVAVSLGSVWAVQRAIDMAAGARQGSIYWAVAVMAVLVLCDFGIHVVRIWVKNILGIKA